MSTWLILNEQNTWWRDKKLINSVEHIKKWMASKVKWFSNIMDLKERGGIVYIIKGPRQVGKSTHIFLKIRELLEKIEPFRILYIHCEAFESRKELDRALREYLKSSNDELVWLFLDEATHIKDWYISIKYLMDIGLLKKAIVVITGSSSLDLSRASNYLSGRRGESFEQNLDRVLLPMSFRDAIISGLGSEELRKFVIKNINKKTLLEILNGDIPKELQRILVFWDEISSSFETYLITGGFPLAMDYYLKHGKIGTNIYTLFITLVRRDLENYGFNPIKVDQVLSRLIETLTEPIDYTTIKSSTDIQSSTRLADYLSALQNSFVITTIPYLNPAERRVILRKRRKYYFRDPFIHHAFKAWSLGLDPYETSVYTVKDPTTRGLLIENVVCEHLVRLVVISNNRSPVDPQSHIPFIGYWRTKKSELDFTIRIGRKYIPLEVKYKERISRSELKTLIEATHILKHKGIVITKKPEDLMEEQYYLAIPAPIFLLLPFE